MCCFYIFWQFFFLNGLFRLNLGVPRLHCLVLLAVCNVYLCRLVDVLKELSPCLRKNQQFPRKLQCPHPPSDSAVWSDQVATGTQWSGPVRLWIIYKFLPGHTTELDSGSGPLQLLSCPDSWTINQSPLHWSLHSLFFSKENVPEIHHNQHLVNREMVNTFLFSFLFSSPKWLMSESATDISNRQTKCTSHNTFFMWSQKHKANKHEQLRLSTTMQ